MILEMLVLRVGIIIVHADVYVGLLAYDGLWSQETSFMCMHLYFFKLQQRIKKRNGVLQRSDCLGVYRWTWSENDWKCLFFFYLCLTLCINLSILFSY